MLVAIVTSYENLYLQHMKVSMMRGFYKDELRRSAVSVTWWVHQIRMEKHVVMLL